ncbi:hypothetical protein GEMRC1_008940 [Eukaryota sp. GEM-RC1]
MMSSKSRMEIVHK